MAHTLEIHRLTVNLTAEDLQTLQRITMTDALRLALQTEDYVYGTRQRGEKILVEKPDGSLREVIF
jgi:hypothetical protein